MLPDIKNFLDFAENHGYKINIRFKNESILMKILSIFLKLLNKNFMTTTVTTIGSTVYFPSYSWMFFNKKRALKVLLHEFVHICDYKELSKKFVPVTYIFLYLFPQILSIFSIFSIFAFINLNYLFFLFFLIFLFPIPSPSRFYFESRAYAMNMYFSRFYYSNINKDIKYDYKKHADNLSKYFFNKKSYFMYPFKNLVVVRLCINFFLGPLISPAFEIASKWFFNNNNNNNNNNN